VNCAIEAHEKQVYRPRMRFVLVRLLALLAVMAMPFGMAAAPATTAHHQPMAMPMEHCPDQPARQAAQMGIGACTMACAGALPAVDLSRAGVPPIASSPDFPAAAERLEGHQPDIATPPPRHS
jgi:hypothetical protein